MLYPKDLTNLKFSRLTVIGFSHIDKYNTPRYNCLCVCGKKTIISRNKLVTKRTRSCGCLKTERVTKMFTKHGLSKHRLYSIYRGILRRCNAPSCDSYKDYGGRGIKCEWKTYIDFYNDMIPSYNEHIKRNSKKNTSIDRKDVNGNYCRENCGWATLKQQARNKRPRPVKLYSYKGESKPLYEWATLLKINYARLKSGIAKVDT